MSDEIKRIGDYEILSELGAGGMGKVYKVRNVISDRIEAMKILALFGDRDSFDAAAAQIDPNGVLHDDPSLTHHPPSTASHKTGRSASCAPPVPAGSPVR